MLPQPVESSDTISLREIGLRLRQIQKSAKKSPNVDRLLSLLIGGKLQAGFICPTLRPRWIRIPKDFWSEVSTDQLHAIMVKGDNDKKVGAFKIRLGQFGPEIRDSLLSEYGKSGANDPDGLAREYTAILARTQKAVEVRMEEASWRAYLDTNDIADPAQTSATKKGTRQKTSWKQIAGIIAAYVAEHTKERSHEIKHSNAAREVLEIARGENILDLPSVDTIATVFKDMSVRLDRRRT